MNCQALVNVGVSCHRVYSLSFFFFLKFIYLFIYIFLLREFQPMASTSNDSSLLSDKDTNWFLV